VRVARRLRNHQAPGSDADLARRVATERAAQGLTPAITDPTTLCRVAALLGGDDPNARERRLAELRRDLAAVEIRMPLLEQPDRGTGERW